jgi:hypothetical protein
MTEQRDPGNDDQMGPERMKHIRDRQDLEDARWVEEQRKVEAQPTTEERHDRDTRDS